MNFSFSDEIFAICLFDILRPLEFLFIVFNSLRNLLFTKCNTLLDLSAILYLSELAYYAAFLTIG